MKKKNFTLILNHFDDDYLGRDVFLVPYYIQKECGYNVTIVYPRTESNQNLPDIYRGVHLHPIRHSNNKSSHAYFLKVAMYLIKNAGKIDILMSLYILMKSGRIALLYKLLNPKGISYVKLDIPTYIVERVSAFFKDKGAKAKFKRIFYRAYFKRVDLFTCESSDSFDLLMKDNLLSPYFKNKTILFENGCDDDLIKELGVQNKPFEEKENIFITVGRLGTYEKHTDLLLQGLKNIDFNGWKAYLIGPIKDEFKGYIEDFFNENPHLKEKIIFTGPIYDKKELWEFYNKAKVFILSSLTESSGLVLYEAKIFKNYIVSTPVGAVKDVIADGCGILTDMHDPEVMANILNEITNGNKEINVYDKLDITQLYWSSQVRNVLKLALNNIIESK